MRKKLLLIILVVTITIQIAIPLGMVIYNAIEISQIKQHGELYTFSGYRPYYSNGRLHVNISLFGPNRQYAILTGESFEHSDDKPDTPYYIDRYGKYYATNDFGVNLPEVYIVTKNYDNITSIDFIKKLSINSYSETPPENVAYYDEVTIDAYIYKGKIYVIEIYIDGVNSETFLENYNNK